MAQSAEAVRHWQWQSGSGSRKPEVRWPDGMSHPDLLAARCSGCAPQQLTVRICYHVTSTVDCR